MSQTFQIESAESLSTWAVRHGSNKSAIYIRSQSGHWTNTTWGGTFVLGGFDRNTNAYPITVTESSTVYVVGTFQQTAGVVSHSEGHILIRRANGTHEIVWESGELRNSSPQPFDIKVTLNKGDSIHPVGSIEPNRNIYTKFEYQVNVLPNTSGIVRTQDVIGETHKAANFFLWQFGVWNQDVFGQSFDHTFEFCVTDPGEGDTALLAENSETIYQENQDVLHAIDPNDGYSYIIYATADNYFTIHIDGQPVLTGTDWTQTYSAVLPVDTMFYGPHSIRIEAYNAGARGGGNPAAVSVVIYRLNSMGQVNDALFHTAQIADSTGGRNAFACPWSADPHIEVKMSDIARRGGGLTFQFPGNWFGKAHRDGNKAPDIQNYQGWRYGYASWAQDLRVTYYDFATEAQRGHVFKGTGWGGLPFLNYAGEAHPATNLLNVIQWKAPRAGRVRMFGVAADVNSGGGNGVIMWLGKMKTSTHVRGADVREFINKPQNTRGIQYIKWNKTVNVKKDDVFSFVVGPDTDQGYDTTNIQWNIYYETVNDFTGAELSLREQTEDIGRYQVLIPRYQLPGSNEPAQNNSATATTFSDRGQTSDVKMSQWIDSTWRPILARQSMTPDTAYYSDKGNGVLDVRAFFHMGGAQWWNKGKTGQLTRSQFRLMNVAPPTGVTFANNFEREWQTGPGAKNGTAVSTLFTGLVGGLYGVQAAYTWITPNQAAPYSIVIDGRTSLPAHVSFIERGMTFKYG